MHKQWMTLSSAAAEAKPVEVPARRLWLTGSVESSPGALGLYRTARTEPMGERLRLLYSADYKFVPACGRPQDPKGALMPHAVTVLP